MEESGMRMGGLCIELTTIETKITVNFDEMHGFFCEF